MTFRIRLFARARDLAGADLVTLTLPEGTTTADLRQGLAREYPTLASLVERSAIACNSEFAQPDQALGPEDEIALLPPVSGGAYGRSWYREDEAIG